MKISELCIKRPVFASMIILALVVFGLTAYRSIGVDLFPDVDFPFVTVTVPYEGADPETVETEVTDKIEEAVNTIAGIKTLRSESLEGLAQVFIEFELEEDVDVVSQDVRDKVAGIRGDLPLEIDPPIVEKLDLDAAAILAIALSGDVPIRELSDYADNVLKPQIEGVAGVGNVRLVGDREREIRVWLRADDILAYGLTAEDVTDALAEENVEPPGGRVETGPREMIVKTKGKFHSVRQFEELIVATRNGVPIRLRDVAWVEDGLEDFRSLSRLDGRRAVSLLVRRQSGENLLAVAGAVKARLAEVEIPEQYNLIVAQDLSIFVDQSISEAEGELLRGGILAVLVILAFLRSFRGSFVAAVTIPTTIIATYTFVLAMGFTVNMMTMLALTISVGMIIDDSIVVLENSYRHMEEGMPRVQAAIAGISEIGFAVVATSLAIVAVFVPVAFMKGIVGRFFYEFGVTVTFAVVISTFIALTLSPMLCSRVLKVSKTHGRLFNLSERAFQRVETWYRAALGLALRHRLLVILGAVVVFVGSLGITFFVGKEFVPEADENQFNVQIQTPIGTSIEATSQVVAEVERRLRGLPGVTATFTTIGSGTEQRVNVATVLTKLVEKRDRTYSQKQIMAAARSRLADLGHLKTSVEAVPRISASGFRNSPLQYNVQGPDLDQLADVAGKLVDQLREVPGIVDVNTTYDANKPEVTVRPDRDRAKDLGVSLRDVGSAVGVLIGGRKATTFEQDGETYDVRVRLARSDRDRPEEILAVPVRNDRGDLVELRSLVEVRESIGPVQIDRQDRQRQITVVGNLEGFKPLASAVEDVDRIAAEVVPKGVHTSFTGHADMMKDSFKNINFSLMLAVVLIYMVLAAQFESLVHPLTVMLSLPLSIVGALGLLALTGRTLNIFSMIGMIMLMGLVTKNAILLIDYTNLLRSRGLEKTEAILTAGPVRLRPILMTALSTIAGMTPVAIGLGEGAESRAPMGTAIVGGMITSTVLTLIVIPVVYSVLDDAGARVRRLVFGPAAGAPGELPMAVHAPAGAARGDGDTLVLHETLTGASPKPAHADHQTAQTRG